MGFACRGLLVDSVPVAASHASQIFLPSFCRNLKANCAALERYCSATAPETSEVPDILIAAQQKISTTHDSYETWREGDHDDLVLSVALVYWAGERYIRKLEPMPKPGLIASEVPANVIGCPAL